MGISPINLARVSQNLRAFNLLNTMRDNQLSLYRTQNRLATGLRFSAPSEDPVRAAQAVKLDRQLDILGQVEGNLREVNAALTEGESAMQEAVDLVMEAHTLALETVGDTSAPEDRAALRVVVDSLIEQLITVGNRRHLDAFLFSGNYGDDVPFEWADDGVIFRGDNGRLRTIVDSDLSEDSFTISGMEFFNAVSSGVQGQVDLDPALTPETRLVDLNGATGSGVSPGRILASDGTRQAEIDLAGVDTIGDVLDKLNAELPATLRAVLADNAVNIMPTGTARVNITITDVAGGNASVELGIHTATPAPVVAGEDLDPKLTPRTALKHLNAGAGIDLRAGLTIRNGGEVARVSFQQATTVEDVLNRINQAGAGVLARVAADGKSIEVLNRVSGADLRIEENDGTAATALGIRSMHAATLLAELNDGQGVASVEGGDLRITTADGTAIDVDIDELDLASATLQDVIDLLNAHGAGAITAALAAKGNGIAITDNTIGGGALRSERLNLSPAIDGLGLNVAASGRTLTGRDVNPVKVDSPFTALLELRAALEADDSPTISAAGQRLSTSLERMLTVQGKLASKATTMQQRAGRIEDETTTTRVLQSDVRDVDMTEAIVRFQQVQTALQANLVTASRIMNLSLLDYLR